MSASCNKVFILGNLGTDPELKYTNSQTAVATLNVATTEYRRSPSGERSENTQWHRIVVWDKMAENCSKFLKKGRSVFVEGRLQTRSWEDKNGEKRYTTEIVAQNVQFIGSGGFESRSDDFSQEAGSHGAAGGMSSNGMGGGSQNGGNFAGSARASGSSNLPEGLDDIPF